MSDNDLMQTEKNIEDTAIEVEYNKKKLAADQPGYQGPGYKVEEPDKEYIERKYRNVVQQLLEPFTQMPDPKSYDAVIESIEYSMKYLSQGDGGSQEGGTTDPSSKQTMTANTHFHWIEEAKQELNFWEGHAGRAFRRNFLGRFRDVATNQFLMLGVLKGCLEADKEVWEQAQLDIKKNADKTEHLLDNAEGWGKNATEFALSVAGAIGSIGSIGFTMGGSSPAAAIGAVGAVGNAITSAKKLEGGGATPDDIVESLKESVYELTEWIKTKQGRVAYTLKAYAGEIGDPDSTEKTDYVTPRPKLAKLDDDELVSDQGVKPRS